MNQKRYRVIIVVLAVLCVCLAGVITYQWYNSSKPTNNFSATEQQNNQIDVKYVASKESDKFHREDCKFAKNIKKSNLVTYETIEEAENSGKRPCSECKPNYNNEAQDSDKQDVFAQENKLIVATNAEFPPFEYKVNNGNGLVGEYDGIDIVIAKKIADSLEKELEITDIRFESILPCLASGKADMGIAGLRATPDRKENADFSEPYYNTKQSLLINMDTSDINSLESLKGKSVGVIVGYDGDILLRDSEGIDVRRYSNGSDIVYDILQGNLDAGIMDTILASGYVNKDDGIRIIDNNLFGEYEEYCIAVRQGNTELLSQVNQIISEMRKTNEIWNVALEVDLRME